MEKCTGKFISSQERHTHCVDSHAYPPKFRWVTPKVSKPNTSKKKLQKQQKKDILNIGEDASNQSNPAMDIDDGMEPRNAQPGKKPLHGFVFGRGNMKKSFNTKSSDWHRRDGTSTTVSALEGSHLSTDLMNSLPSNKMS